MCFGGSKSSSQQADTTSQTANIPAREMNKQPGPVDAEGEIGTEKEEDAINQKKKGRRSLRIPLITGTSGVQTGG